MNSQSDCVFGKHYRIVITGEFDQSWQRWLEVDDIQTTKTEGREAITILNTKMKDQAQLRGLLLKLWDLNQEILFIQVMNAFQLEWIDMIKE